MLPVTVNTCTELSSGFLKLHRPVTPPNGVKLPRWPSCHIFLIVKHLKLIILFLFEQAPQEQWWAALPIALTRSLRELKIGKGLESQWQQSHLHGWRARRRGAVSPHTPLPAHRVRTAMVHRTECVRSEFFPHIFKCPWPLGGGCAFPRFVWQLSAFNLNYIELIFRRIGTCLWTNYDLQKWIICLLHVSGGRNYY